MVAVAILALVLSMPTMFDYETTQSRAWRVWAGYMEDRQRDTTRLAREARAAGDRKAEAMWLDRARGFAEKREQQLECMRRTRGNYVRDILSKLDFLSRAASAPSSTPTCS